MHKIFDNKFGCHSFLQDKYFQGLYCYNKNQISHKSHFFSNTVPFSDISTQYKEFLNELGFAINPESPNYKFAVRYFNSRYNDFSWISSGEKKLFSEKYFDVKEKKMASKNIMKKFTDKILSLHLFGYSKSNRYPFFVYKCPDKHQLIEEFDTSLKNIYKTHNKTFGATQRIGTDILWLDIDNVENRSAIETLGMFCDHFDIKLKDFIFYEQNYFTGGIHAFLKLPTIISNANFYSEFEKYLKENDINIECNFQNKVLRLPLSFEYNTYYKDEKIFANNEFISDEFMITSWNNFNPNIPNKPIRNKKIQDLIERFSENKIPNYWDKTIQRFKNQKKKPTIKQLYSIGCGERWEKTKKMVPYLKAMDKSLDETVNILIEQNTGSKDLSKWSYNKIKKSIESFYNKCNIQINYTTNTNFNGFISNKKYLNDTTNKFLENPLFIRFFVDKTLNNYMQERNKHGNTFKSFSQEKKNVLYIIMSDVLKEIIGSMYYSINNKKELIDTKLQSKLGFQLSDTQFNSIINQAIISKHLQNNTYAKFSTQYLKKAILKSLNINEIKLNFKRNWLNGFCKSYATNSINNIREVLEHLYNSFMNKDIIHKFITNYNNVINNHNILYILLQVKSIGYANGMFFDNLSGEIIEDIPKIPI